MKALRQRPLSMRAWPSWSNPRWSQLPSSASRKSVIALRGHASVAPHRLFEELGGGTRLAEQVQLDSSLDRPKQAIPVAQFQVRRRIVQRRRNPQSLTLHHRPDTIGAYNPVAVPTRKFASDARLGPRRMLFGGRSARSGRRSPGRLSVSSWEARPPTRVHVAGIA